MSAEGDVMDQLDIDIRSILGFGLAEMELLAGIEGQKTGMELLFEAVEKAEKNAEVQR